MHYRLLADLVLLTHVGIVAFVVLSLPLILIGGFLGWRWVRNPRFRFLHLGTLGVVTGQAFAGLICPLTTLEIDFRARAGEAVYQGGFVSHWLRELLYVEASLQTLAWCYTLFLGAVVAAWLWVRPEPWTPERDASNDPGIE